jgi:hypothetical protein
MMDKEEITLYFVATRTTFISYYAHRVLYTYNQRFPLMKPSILEVIGEEVKVLRAIQYQINSVLCPKDLRSDLSF